MTAASEFPARSPQRLQVSFEFSPPRTEAAENTLWETVKRLTPLEPALELVAASTAASLSVSL